MSSKINFRPVQIQSTTMENENACICMHMKAILAVFCFLGGSLAPQYMAFLFQRYFMHMAPRLTDWHQQIQGIYRVLAIGHDCGHTFQGCIVIPKWPVATTNIILFRVCLRLEPSFGNTPLTYFSDWEVAGSSNCIIPKSHIQPVLRCSLVDDPREFSGRVSHTYDLGPLSTSLIREYLRRSAL